MVIRFLQKFLPIDPSLVFVDLYKGFQMVLDKVMVRFESAWILSP